MGFKRLLWLADANVHSKGNKKFPEDKNRNSRERITVTQLIYALMIAVWKETKIRNYSTIQKNHTKNIYTYIYL